MTKRTLRSFAATLVLTGLIALAYGLDWQAALWGEYRGPVHEHTDPDGISTRWRCDNQDLSSPDC